MELYTTEKGTKLYYSTDYDLGAITILPDKTKQEAIIWKYAATLGSLEHLRT